MCNRCAMVVAVLLALSIGCTRRLGDFTALATQSVQLKSTQVKAKAEGKDCVTSVLGFPVSGSLAPSLKEASDRALSQAPGATVLENVSIYVDYTSYFLAATNCFKVVGDAGTLALGGVR